VSQISPPIRILLVCAVAFIGAYMLFLRPKDAAVPPADPAPNIQTNAPAVSAPGKAVEAAQGAVAAADGQLSQQESVDGVDAGENAAGTQSATKASKSNGAQPAAAKAAKVDVAGLPKPVAKAIRKGQVLVLLFWNGKSADDKAVHKALAKVDRWDGRVSVRSASITKISKYGRIARGVDVEQSPTVVVADPELRAETLVGYVDTQTIDQAVVDAFRNSGGLFTDAYLRKVDSVCVHYSSRIGSIPNFYGGGSVKKMDTRLNRVDDQIQALIADFNAVKAPKKWRSFRTASAKDLRSLEVAVAQYAATVKPNSSVATVLGAEAKYRQAARTPGKSLNHRMDGHGLFRCGSAF
jgi:hypothetical protein